MFFETDFCETSLKRRAVFVRRLSLSRLNVRNKSKSVGEGKLQYFTQILDNFRAANRVM